MLVRRVLWQQFYDYPARDGRPTRSALPATRAASEQNAPIYRPDRSRQDNCPKSRNRWWGSPGFVLFRSRIPGPSAERQPVFSCQPEHHIKNIRSAADTQRMPIQVSRLEPGCQHGFDLRPEFHFQLIQLDLRQKFRHVFKVVEIARLIDQGWHLFPGSYRVPSGNRPNHEMTVR